MTAAPKHFLFTVDVDWIPGSHTGLKGLYDFCERHDLRSTLFIAGRFAERYPEIVREGAERGHELGTHGWEHGQKGKEDEENFQAASYEQQTEWMRRSTEAVADAAGVRPVAFRAPNLLVGETTFRVLREQGYRYDSSVPARRLSVTYGSLNLPRYYWAPLEPYHPDERDLARTGDSPILEVPPSSFFVPLNMSALRVLGLRSCCWAVRRVARRSPSLVFFSHPSEFVPADQQEIPAVNPKRHLEGIGPQNFDLLGRFVEYVKSRGYASTTYAGLASERRHRHD